MPVDGYALLSALLGVGSEDGAVTGFLWNTATNLRQTETEIGLPLHNVMTHLQNQRWRSMCGKKREGHRRRCALLR